MDPGEERLEAQMLTSSLTQVYSIADWDLPLAPWPIPEPIYNKKGANLFVPLSKSHQNPIIFHKKEGSQPPILVEPFGNKGRIQFH